MLWFKFWLEMRLRALVVLGMVLFALFSVHSQGRLQIRSGAVVLPFFRVLVPLLLAGSGLRTEPVLQPMRGLHGSTNFTLSLPVSRWRVLAIRACAGLLAIAAIIFAVCCVAGVFFPEVRVSAGLSGGLIYAATLLLCSCGVYGLSTFFATFLELQYQIWAAGLVVFLVKWLVDNLGLPGFIDPFRAMGGLSPLFTHAFPWAAIGVSLGFGVLFFLAAAMVVQKREY